MYFHNSVRLKNTFFFCPAPHLNTVTSSKWIASDYWQKSFPHWNGWSWVFSFALQVICSFSPIVPWSKAPNKLYVCAQLLRLLVFTEHGKATEIKHSHWYSYIYVQNYSQCWQILGGRKENRNAWVLTTLHAFLWPNSKKASWSACFYQTSPPPASLTPVGSISKIHEHQWLGLKHSTLQL